jgi:ribosomal-protein-alanine N-acetyltransferase
MTEIFSVEKEDLLPISEMESTIFPSDPWSREGIMNHLDTNYGSGLILKSENERIGYLLSGRIGDEAELLRIGILPEKRKCGYGNLLLSHWLEEEKRKGALHFFLEVRKQNRSAAALYEKNGFVLAGTRKNYYKDPIDDALLYQIHIKESEL